jgi:hypothetical protein
MCNSLKNYANDFNNDTTNPRYSPVYFLRLIENPDEYTRHKSAATDEYKKLSHFLWHIRDCERSEQILHELSMLGIEGVHQGISSLLMDETNRIWNLFLKKAYWRD